jgi:hypothetical protein
LLLLLLPHRLCRLRARGSFWLWRFQQCELSALLGGHLWLGFLRLWLRCGLLAWLHGRRRLPGHRSGRVLFILQAETRLISAILCRHGSISGGRQWRRSMGILVRLEYRILRRLVRTLRFACLHVGGPWLWRAVRSRNERQLDGRFLWGRNRDRFPDRQHETHGADDKEVEQDRGSERHQGFPAFILAPDCQCCGAHAGRVLLIRAWWKRYCWM